MVRISGLIANDSNWKDEIINVWTLTQFENSTNRENLATSVMRCQCNLLGKEKDHIRK